MMDWHSVKGGVKIPLVPSCDTNGDKLWPHGPLGSCADLTYLAPVLHVCILWEPAPKIIQ